MSARAGAPLGAPAAQAAMTAASPHRIRVLTPTGRLVMSAMIREARPLAPPAAVRVYAGRRSLGKDEARVTLRRLHAITGLLLFTYVITHLTNHALGLISLEAMEAGRWWFLALWRNPVGTLALYGALLTHFMLALVSLYRRRHLRMPAWEATQLVLGLALPPLLVSHIVGTRLAHAL